METAFVVLDVGKTRSKMSLWSSGGKRLAQLDRTNRRPERDGFAQLDVEGVREWLTQGLAAFAVQARIGAIIPVGHGAAGVLVSGEAVIAAPDYETSIAPDVASAYDAERDPFAATLSPRLEGGLNLGVQLFDLERRYPDVWPRAGRVLLWPQFWAWLLSGEAASEVTSLGCHSDLWRPMEGRFSDLAVRRGWAERLGPLRRADDVLGVLRANVARASSLPGDCLVLCGLHDSNAALHGVRAHPELAGRAFAVVSTGTWFVCLASGGTGPAAYDEASQMLANVDVEGRPTPTARFMGGRDYEAWMARADEDGAWATKAAADLARKTDAALSLINAEGPIVVEGRFATQEGFVSALAALRPSQSIYRSPDFDGVARGALRLALPDLTPAEGLERIGG
ncbi:MAG: carbohydrate kinase [Caulobacterales bacterium]